ncbi:MAG TPA: DUF5996 family protein [Rhizomicrobium sp.]|jgi:hypothetical protein|nr:DUF5996 family protein [Rhizomicrobium sp.]
MNEPWPELPYEAWKDTCSTLQLWMQIVGKTRVALTPWLNHSWHVTLEVTARGLGTPLIHARGQSFQIEFDLIDHLLHLRTSAGRNRQMVLRPMSVADFHRSFLALLADAGIAVRVDAWPNEIPDAIPFREDHVHAAYDAEFANRFWRVLLGTHEVFSRFRTAFLGKSSPVHFFWGSFDLAVTRFSGRRAPLHPGGVPHLPDSVVQEAYSHEVSSAGFWPGGGPVEYAAFYSYAYPAPEGFSTARVQPSEAFFSAELGEYLLPYEAVQCTRSPEHQILEFLETTYSAAAGLGGWDRAALECSPGELRKPRKIY